MLVHKLHYNIPHSTIVHVHVAIDVVEQSIKSYNFPCPTQSMHMYVYMYKGVAIYS